MLEPVVTPPWLMNGVKDAAGDAAVVVTVCVVFVGLLVDPAAPLVCAGAAALPCWMGLAMALLANNVDKGTLRKTAATVRATGTRRTLLMVPTVLVVVRTRTPVQGRGHPQMSGYRTRRSRH